MEISVILNRTGKSKMEIPAKAQTRARSAPSETLDGTKPLPLPEIFGCDLILSSALRSTEGDRSSKVHTPAFTLDDGTLEDIGRRLGQLYQDVSLSREPMFAWVQLISDATALGKELRRDRRSDALLRAGDVLTRLLEFVGYYQFVHKIPSQGKPLDFADMVAETLRLPAYEGYADNISDGPSRWVIVKYPFACAKCGQLPCHCVVEPWILENRREKPGPYEKFRNAAEAARKRLNDQVPRPFTIRQLTEHFNAIYKASYYHQEPWKIGMHLSEELGEATTELGRMGMVFRARDTINLANDLEEIFRNCKTRLAAETRRMEGENRETRARQLDERLLNVKAKLESSPWHGLSLLLGERFKEEIADVLSWLSAIIVKLDDDQLGTLARALRRFVQTKGGTDVLSCPWCKGEQCSNECLVQHDVSGEIIESVSKF